MNAYRFNITKLGKETFWSIYEVATEQVIQSFRDEKKAKEIYRGLKRGKGFQGWTPMFFAREVLNVN